MSDIKNRDQKRKARHQRIRRHLRGTAACPRLAVFKSAKHIYAQVIDDVSGKTLACASTVIPALRDQVKSVKPLERAKLVGTEVAKRAKDKGVEAVIFDRGGFPYIGRIRAFAEAARKGGLKF